MDKIYSAENRARLEKKENYRHRKSLRDARDKNLKMRSTRLSVRAERQSIQEEGLKAEKLRVERMSLEEKAARKRQQRKTLKERTAGRSEFITIEEVGDDEDEDENDDGGDFGDERKKKFRQSYQASNFNHLAGIENELVPPDLKRSSGTSKKKVRRLLELHKFCVCCALTQSNEIKIPPPKIPLPPP